MSFYFYYYRGRFANFGAEVVYVGAKIKPRHRLDPDRIGFLNLVDEVEKLGCRCGKLSYRIPGLSLIKGLREMKKKHKQVMQML